VTPRRTQSPAELYDAASSGDRTAIARLLSLIERGGEEAREIGRLAAPSSGDADTVGITGAPGSGKSTLTSALVGHVRSTGAEVAVLAIDPSSPFTGGAILGDRVRMQDHATDPGVFIRSMATRGHLGGLALATPEAIRLLDALGHRLILVETVGVGQVEVEVAGKADTTIVVVNPGWGDSVQANKAGLMEVADIFVINKADRPGADETRRDLEQMLDLAGSAEWPTHESLSAWRPPIVCTVATTGDGVVELWDAVVEHRHHAAESGLLERRRAGRLREELGEVVARRLRQRAEQLCGEERWRQLTDAVLSRELDPWAAADEMIAPTEAAARSDP
jgi:LAO/AO transport system kinase